MGKHQGLQELFHRMQSTPKQQKLETTPLKKALKTTKQHRDKQPLDEQIS